jgi:hypothetical protein
MLVRKYLEISEYNFRANIIIKNVSGNNSQISEINYGLIINIIGK